MDTVMDTSKKRPLSGLNWLLLELEKYMCLSFLLKECKKGKKKKTAFKNNVELM